MEADPDGTLARIRGLGISRVEAFAFATDADALAGRLQDAGLSAESGHEAFLEESISFGGRTIRCRPGR
jgi:hypothetical protein